MNEEEKPCWKILKLISKLARGSKVEYEIEHKDGLPHKIKNVRIEQIELDKDI